ncbi:MAG: hypothetical protein P4L10_11000 [Acidobacteriaceae bacterium]|nr:hypothetical protein [Acidobacteriaceae bacterium]
MAKNQTIATATSTRGFRGMPEVVNLETFKTVRNGQKVVRFRWIDCGFAASFPTIDRAIKAAQSHAQLSNIQTVEA